MDNCCCIDNLDFEVKKNVTFFYKMVFPGSTTTTGGIEFNRLVVGFEIILNNKSCHTIKNLNIKDSLFGIGLTQIRTQALIEFEFHVTVTSCCDNIVANDEETILNTCGQLIDPTQSFMPPCSVCVILVEIAIKPNGILETNTIDMPYLFHTNIVTGTVDVKKSNFCDTDCKNIKPIVLKEAILDEPDVLVPVDIFFPGSCSLNCLPYTNTRCNRVTCPRKRPK
jgi:hypothetical protein